MPTRHTTLDSPLGELVLVADDDALTGVYFRHHWHPPAAGSLGGYAEATGDDLFGETARQVGQYLAGQRRRFDLPTTLAENPQHLDLEQPTPVLAGRLF